MSIDPISILVAFDIFGLAMGASLLWWRSSPNSNCWLRDGTTFTCVGLTLLVLAWFVGRIYSGFFVLRLLVHALSCVLAPLMLVRGAWHLRRRAHWCGSLLLAAGLLVEGVYLYAKNIEPVWLEVTHYDYVSPRLGRSETPIRIVVLADLQTDRIGEYEREVFATMDELRADLILLPGDYIQITEAAGGIDEAIERERQVLVELFNGLTHRPRYGIWGVDGDVDSAAETFRGSVAQPLFDETIVLPGSPRIQVIGLSRPASRKPLTGDQLASIRDFDGLTIVMGHAPDFVVADIEACEARGPVACPVPMLCIAGHTHGGQVVIPGFGPPITLSRIPRRYAAGMHHFGRMTLFVSRGVGHERGLAPRIRFNCRPELAVIIVR